MKKETIVILHGWGLSGKRFASLATSLRKLNYQVLSPDLPGFGDSKFPDKPLTLTDYAKFFQQYLEIHKVKKPILIGHSFGGRLALKFNQLYPKSVKALILSGTPGFTPIARQKLSLFIALAKIGKRIFSLPLIGYFKNDVQRWYYYAVGAREFYRAEGVMRQTFKNVVQEELLTAMKQVSMPCILIWGKNDIIIPVNIAKRMLEVIKGAKLVVIQNADHGVPYKQPEIFMHECKKFLRTL